MNRTIVAAAILSLLVSAVPASAQDDGVAATAASTVVWPTTFDRALRPKALPALYASYAALQAFDVFSTRQALSRGAREANPLMQDAVRNTGTFVAVKATVATATIVAAERLWKHNKGAAIAVMVASNGVAAVVAARNARTLRPLR